jgi:hypothetical protein
MPLMPQPAGTPVSDTSPHRIARSAAVIFVACCGGWFIMELEILGARALQPFFGSDIYVTWGSVIGVFLLSLSIGYMLGGWLSRKPCSRIILGVNLIIAGAWLALVPSLTEWVCEGLYSLGLREKSGSLIASLTLFGVPTVILGTVSPTAVRWLTRKADESGLKAGMVLALSTVASFAGCVITAFYLVSFSLKATLRISAACLALLGAAVLCSAMMFPNAGPAGGNDAGS